jgi:hypothetical protein
LCRALLLGTVCLAPFQAAASTTDPAAPQITIPREALLKLGQKFVNTVGHKMTEADLFLSGAGKIELAEYKSRTRLPDNEPLIMRAAAAGGKLALKQDIYAIKRGNRLMISLADFFLAVDFAISVNPESGTADGWFIREDQKFHLDAKKREAVIMGETQSFNAADIEVEGDNLLASSSLLEKWFRFTFDYNFASLTLALTTTQPLPLEEAFNRGKRRGNRNYSDNVARLPEQKVPYAMLSAPYVDVTTTSLWQRSPGARPARSNTFSAIANNDVAGFNLQSFISGNVDQEPYINSMRLTMGRQDPDGNLLGPLHATAYNFGDIAPVSVPLLGGSGIEQGASVTNRPAGVTTQTALDIDGNGKPGWDVELYRNGTYIAMRRIDITGYYNFEKTDLVLGVNDMKLLFYGPQGEIREENRVIQVDPGLLAGHAGYYAASVSRQGITMWQPEKPVGPDVGAINTAATYEYGLGPQTTVNAGVRRRSDDGEERVFGGAGLATYLGGTYLNAGTAVDAQTGAATASLTARRNFGLHSGLLEYTWSAEDFSPSSPAGTSAVRDAYRAALSGPIPTDIPLFRRASYTLNGSSTQNYDGGSVMEAGSSLSARMSALSFSAGMNYSLATSADGETTETAAVVSNVHGFAFGGNWRVNSRHNVIPDTRLTETSLQYDRPINDTIDTTATLKYTPDPDLYDAALSLNWRTPKATISPSVAMDTNENLRLGVNVHFGLAADPYAHSYKMYNAYMAGSGGVAARVFYDRNGNGVYDGDDELMPDVVIRAQQIHRSAVTDQRGIAFLADIPQNTLTDIVADPSSFQDSFGVGLFKGVSLRTHPGSVTRIDFPVVTGGELDGQADAVDAAGARKSAANLKISLIAPDGTVEKTVRAASDGYYAISSINPGVYYLTAETRSTGNENGRFLPRLMTFKPEGTTLYGQPVVLEPGYNTRFIYTSENAAPSGEKRARVIRPEDIESQKVSLRLGQYHSRLALTFSWYRFKIRSAWGKDFSLAKDLMDISPNPKTQLMDLDIIPHRALTMEQAAGVCQTLQENKFDCAVRIVTKYRHAAPVAESKAKKSG